MNSSSSFTTVVVGGLAVHVYGLASLPPTSPSIPASPIAVLFLLHGRYGAALEPKTVAAATALVQHAAEQRQQAGSASSRPLLVVTFDQRNHGERVVDMHKNKGWKDKFDKDAVDESDELDNLSHASDMLAIQSESSGHHMSSLATRIRRSRTANLD